MTETHRLLVASFLLPMLQSGNKTLEVQIESAFTRKFGVGDIINFNERVRLEVVDVRRYHNLRLALENEPAEKIVPGYSRDQAYNFLEHKFGKTEVLKSVLVFELHQPD